MSKLSIILIFAIISTALAQSELSICPGNSRDSERFNAYTSGTYTLGDNGTDSPPYGLFLKDFQAIQGECNQVVWGFSLSSSGIFRMAMEYEYNGSDGSVAVKVHGFAEAFPTDGHPSYAQDGPSQLCYLELAYEGGSVVEEASSTNANFPNPASTGFLQCGAAQYSIFSKPDSDGHHLVIRAYNEGPVSFLSWINSDNFDCGSVDNDRDIHAHVLPCFPGEPPQPPEGCVQGLFGALDEWRGNYPYGAFRLADDPAASPPYGLFVSDFLKGSSGVCDHTTFGFELSHEDSNVLLLYSYDELNHLADAYISGDVVAYELDDDYNQVGPALSCHIDISFKDGYGEYNPNNGQTLVNFPDVATNLNGALTCDGTTYVLVHVASDSGKVLVLRDRNGVQSGSGWINSRDFECPSARNRDFNFLILPCTDEATLLGGTQTGVFLGMSAGVAVGVGSALLGVAVASLVALGVVIGRAKKAKAAAMGSDSDSDSGSASASASVSAKA